jgi:MerR, DNA binding
LLALQDNPDHPCEAADAIARARLADVEARIAALSALKAELARMVSGHGHGKVAICRIIEVLGDHAKCEHHRAEGGRSERQATPWMIAVTVAGAPRNRSKPLSRSAGR